MRNTARTLRHLAAIGSVLAVGCGGGRQNAATSSPEPTANRPTAVARGGGSAGAARVVDMIPEALSLETNQDSEPFLAVHGLDTSSMVASAFTRDPGGPSSPTAPVFISQDGGDSWTLNSIVPSPSMTFDITHAFDTKALYTGILRATDGDLLELITNDVTSSALMVTQASRSDDDQPFVRVTAANGKTFVYIGNNDTGQSLHGGKTATVDVSDNGGTTYRSIRLESRQAADISSCTGAVARQDGPSVRPSVAKDGVVYAAYFGWRTFTGTCASASVVADVVVARDDRWGAQGFQDLVDAGDHLSGTRVVTGVKIPWSNDGTLAHERVGSTLALAVDPNNSQRVWVAWADSPGTADAYTIHVRASADRGATWSSADLFSRGRSTNAALAVADNGTVALAYQELVTAGSAARWRTHLAQTRDDFATIDDLVLADTPADEPQPQFLPYLGDYLGLVAVGSEFRGVFSASNYPDRADFPQGVKYQRRSDFGSHKLLDLQGNEVSISIDPFYFAVPVKR